MPFGGGGGGGTQTVVQNNTPFNAPELQQVQQRAIGLLDSNPLSYYPDQTYAGPNGLQQQSLDDLGNNSLYGARLIGDLANINQQSSLDANNSNIQLTGVNRPLVNLGSENPASQGVNNLQNSFAPGAWFQNNAQNYQNNLINETNSGAAQNLGTYGSGAYLNAQAPWTSSLAQSGQFGPGAANLGWVAGGNGLAGLSPLIGGLQGVASSGAAANALSNISSSGYFNGLQPTLNSLYGVGFGSPEASSLGSTASGAYLGSNPFLDATFNSGARQLTNAFQTATQPGIDSRFELAGRGSSGANFNAQDIAQQNLGKGLGDLAAGVYEPAYENERNRQIQSASALGSLQTGALSNLGSLYNQGVNTIGSAATGLGGLQTNAYGTAGSLYNTGVGLNSQAASNLGDLYQRGLTNALTTQNQSMGIAANAADALMRNQTTAFSNAGQLGNQTGDILRQAYNNQANASTLGQSSQISALDAAIRSQQAAINAAPQLAGMRNQNYNTALQAGTQQQQYQQQMLNDLQQRYYGNAYSPYQTLAQVAGMIGSSIPGTVSQTNPVGSSGLSQLIGGASAANSLFGSGGLFGSSGGLGGLFGGGSSAGLGGFLGSLGGGVGADSMLAAALAAPAADAGLFGSAAGFVAPLLAF